MHSEVLDLIDREIFVRKRELGVVLRGDALASAVIRHELEKFNYYPVDWLPKPEFIDLDLIEMSKIKLAFVLFQINNMPLRVSIPCNLRGSPSDLLWILLLYETSTRTFPLDRKTRRGLINLITTLIPDNSHGFRLESMDTTAAFAEFFNSFDDAIRAIQIKLKAYIES